nr:MAG TPA: hypothetical protein [Caudoviricetes sp.]
MYNHSVFNLHRTTENPERRGTGPPGETGGRERRKYPNSKPQALGSGKAHHGRGRRKG